MIRYTMWNIMQYSPLLWANALGDLAFPFGTFSINVSNPEDNAPLDHVLAYYRLVGYNGAQNDHLAHDFFDTTCGARLSVHYSQPSAWDGLAGTAEKPVLVLTHGYPESSYIWRDVSPTISQRVPVFIPDQPGYGLSSACCKKTDDCVYDKRTYAQAIMQVVHKIYGDSHVIYAGHDRGARTMHRAAVDNNFPGITGLGFFAADIVPYIAEYASFTNPFWSQNYFHWAFLPKGEFATNVIMAYGGGNWVNQIFKYGSGLNEEGIARFKSGNAWQIYENFFNQLAITNASVFDYAAGATTDYEDELWDQGNSTKVSLPTHILYSIYNLASAFDVQAIWANYTHPSAGLTTKGIGGQHGHFIIEEAPEDTIEQLNTFLDRLDVSKNLRTCGDAAEH